MLNNLRNELFRRNRTIREYAEYIGVSKSTALSYITEESDIPKTKMDKTRELFPECTYEYLFASQNTESAGTMSIHTYKDKGRYRHEG